MRIDVIGGGPAGLYSAILLKKSFPSAAIRVTERNRPDDTFGFGIVLSDRTLGQLREADEPTHREIASSFAYWDDIYVQYRGQVMKSSGHGFSGLRRLTLLEILQRRARALGIEMHFRTEDAGVRAHAGADLVVAADGMNSVIREGWKAHFDPRVALHSNRYAWLGAKMDLPGFYHSFREDRGGIWTMHAYQYRPGESTIVIETTGEAFVASGLAVDDEAAAVRHVERVFADDLNGARVLANRSLWRRFPTIRCRTWRHREGDTWFVLLGDAAHTAHFSIGSGTRLALEDAIALDRAMVAQAQGIAPRMARIEAALDAYEAGRRGEVARLQRSAGVSLAWFENVRRYWHMAPAQFHFSLLTRSEQITYEKLRLRDADLVARATAWWNREQAGLLGIEPTAAAVQADDGRRVVGAPGAPGAPVRPPWLDAPPLFAPFRLREAWLCNRVVVSPMAQYCAPGGVPGDWHLVHYGSRALGGAGLVCVEMTGVSPEGRATPGCTGLWNDTQARAFARIVDFVHAHTQAKLCVQLGHAGSRGSTRPGWEHSGEPLEESDGQRNWPLLAPSPLPWREGVSRVPREMTREDMDRVVEQFRHAAMLAVRAGFDMLELQMAHGFLLAAFLSPVANRRRDAYGGPLERRMRFPLEVFEAVRAAWPRARPLGVRIAAAGWIPGSDAGDEAVRFVRALAAAGCDLVAVASGEADRAAQPVGEGAYQALFAERVRLGTGVPTMAVGGITSADQANTLLVAGRADLVALGRPHLADPYFTLHAAADAGFRGVGWPVQYHGGATQWYATTRRARDDASRRRQRAVARKRAAGD